MHKKNNSIRNKRKISVSNYKNNIEDREETNKLLTKGFSREIKFTIISIFVVTIIMISSAFAIFSSIEKSEKSNTLVIGTLSVDFSANDSGMGNTINLNGAYPKSDLEGLKETPYSFKITNSGNVDAGYKIRIIDDIDMINEDSCNDNLLDKSNLRVSIDGKDPFTLSDTSLNDYIIETGYLSAGNSKEYSIRVWLNENSGNEVLGKHYHAKIVIEAQNTSTLCSIISGDGTQIGDEIVCGTESFNVISSDESNINMIAKYNLNVGDNKNPNKKELIQGQDILGFKDNFPTYGNVSFSTTNYWNGTIGFIYNENSLISQYLDSYKKYLLDRTKMSEVLVTLLSSEQANMLGCNINTNTCLNSPYSFLYNTSYFLGSSANANDIYVIEANGNYTVTNYNNSNYFGVRPVITIKKQVLK